MIFHVHIQSIPRVEEVSTSWALVFQVVECFSKVSVHGHVHLQSVSPIKRQLASWTVEGGPHLKARGRLISFANICLHNNFIYYKNFYFSTRLTVL